MKNLINPKTLATFKKDPVPLSDIVKFLDNNQKISTKQLCELIGIKVKKIYDYKSRQKKKLEATTSPLKVIPKIASKRYNRYSAEEKFALVEEYTISSDSDQGKLLRKYGLYKSDIDKWKHQIKEAALVSLGKRKTRSDKKSADQIKIEELEKELKEQEKTTAKLSTLLVFQKKTFNLLKKYE
jgi:transposase